MKIIVVIVLFFVFSTTNAQEINQFDANNKRHGIWQKKYNNGRIRYEGVFNHGKEIGIFKSYSAAKSDHPTIIREFNSSNNIATVKFYSKSGKLKSTGKMDGKNRIEKWLYYHNDGNTIMQEEFYVNNILNGDYKTFYSNKKPAILTFYQNGKIHGSYKRYSINNHIYQDLTYVNGKLEGKAIYHDRLTGIIRESGNYHNDIRIGSWKIYIDGEYSHSIEAKKPKH